MIYKELILKKLFNSADPKVIKELIVVFAISNLTAISSLYLILIKILIPMKISEDLKEVDNKTAIALFFFSGLMLGASLWKSIRDIVYSKKELLLAQNDREKKGSRIISSLLLLLAFTIVIDSFILLKCYLF